MQSNCRDVAVLRGFTSQLCIAGTLLLISVARQLYNIVPCYSRQTKLHQQTNESQPDLSIASVSYVVGQLSSRTLLSNHVCSNINQSKCQCCKTLCDKLNVSELDTGRKCD